MAGVILLAGLCLADDVKFTSDITRLGVGARPLGMGKMFTGLSDDISSIYLNPGGLANIENVQALTMFGKFVNMVNYYTVAAAFPTGYGTLGIGYAGAGFGFNTPVLNLVEIATGEYRVIPSSTESVSYNYNNSAMAFSYGTTLFRPDLSFGAALKMFTENISGTAGGNARGYDLDFGVLFKPNQTLTLGFLGKNFLPASLGGKVVWGNNVEESMPASFVAGGSLKLKLLGEMILGADYETRPTQANVPALWHLGAEWWPVPLLALRGGVDQDVVGRGDGAELKAANNPTYGVSLKAGDFRFDYAYHRYNDIASNDTQYFSIVYEAPSLVPIDLKAPRDKLVTDEAVILFKGKVNDTRIKILKINDQTVALDPKRMFTAEVEARVGKNTFWVSGFDEKGKKIAGLRRRVLRLRSYSDVAGDFWAKEPIEYAGTLGLMTSYPDGTFKPNDKVRRMSLVIDLLSIDPLPAPKAKKLPFKDVTPRKWFSSLLGTAYSEKLARGYPDKTFKPWKSATRLEGIIFAVRYARYDLPEVLERPYEDIPARYWAIKEITAAKEKSMLEFVSEKLDPKKNLTRAELAAVLSKTPKVMEKIDELLNFGTGYETKSPY